MISIGDSTVQHTTPVYVSRACIVPHSTVSVRPHPISTISFRGPIFRPALGGGQKVRLGKTRPPPSGILTTGRFRIGIREIAEIGEHIKTV